VRSGCQCAERNDEPNPNIAEELKKGKQIADATYKVHLDGYNQLDMITGRGGKN
jgi:arylsulfatase